MPLFTTSFKQETPVGAFMLLLHAPDLQCPDWSTVLQDSKSSTSLWNFSCLIKVSSTHVFGYCCRRHTSKEARQLKQNKTKPGTKRSSFHDTNSKIQCHTFDNTIHRCSTCSAVSLPGLVALCVGLQLSPPGELAVNSYGRQSNTFGATGKNYPKRTWM